MSDLIKKQDVIDLLELTRESEHKKSISAECKHKSVIRSKHDAHVAFCNYLIEYVKQVPTHPTPSNTLGTLDCISRQDVIDALQKEINKGIPPFDDVMGSIRCGVRLARNIIEDLPSVQLRKGKWIRSGSDIFPFECDQCGDTNERPTSWCPHCGCRMEEGDSDE